MRTILGCSPACHPPGRSTGQPPCLESPLTEWEGRLGSSPQNPGLVCRARAGRSWRMVETLVGCKDCAGRAKASIPWGSPPTSRPIFQDFPCGVQARSSGDSPAGMGAGAAQIQPIDRGPVPRPPRDGPKEEGLVQRHLPVIDVALREPEPGLEVEGREDLTIQHQSLEPGDEVREDRDDPVGELLPLRIPPAAT